MGRRHGLRVHDGRILTDVPDTVWGTEATTEKTLHKASNRALAVIDHYAGELVGRRASRPSSHFEALEPVNLGVREPLGRIEADVVAGLIVRHDLGTRSTSRAYRGQLDFLGVESNPGFVHSAEGNAVAEYFFRARDGQLLLARNVSIIEDLGLGLLDLQRTHGACWMPAPAPAGTPRATYGLPTSRRSDGHSPARRPGIETARSTSLFA